MLCIVCVCRGLVFSFEVDDVRYQSRRTAVFYRKGQVTSCWGTFSWVSLVAGSLFQFSALKFPAAPRLNGVSFTYFVTLQRWNPAAEPRSNSRTAG